MKKNIRKGGRERAGNGAASWTRFPGRWAAVVLGVFTLLAGPAAAQTVDALQGQTCAGARPGGKLVCSAGEFTTIVKITNAPGSPTSCVAGGSVTLIGSIELSGTNADRYNIGFFTGESGNDPRGDVGSCSVATFPTGPSPWLNLDGNACGDYLNNGFSTPTIRNIRVLCDGNNDGKLQIPYVLTYAQNTNTCTGPDDVINGAPSKCNSGTAVLDGNFSVNGSVTVTKRTIPAGDAQSFAFTATGAGTVMAGDDSFNLSHNGSKQVRMAISQTAKRLTIVESATPFWESTASISCTRPGGGSASTFVTTDNATRTIRADLSNANPNAECTITNTKRSKVTIASSVGGRLNGTDQFTVSATGGGTLTDTSGASLAAPVTVTTTGTNTSASRTFWSQPGQALSMTETAASGNLGNYNISYSCTNATAGSATVLPSGSGTTLSLTPAPGDDITCTFSNQVVPGACSPPDNIPEGVSVTCQCDNFGRASLNPSTIFGANWWVNKSDNTNVVPYINQTTGHLRLTENTRQNAKAATVPGIFPAAGNYISIEFKHFAYRSTTNPGADGIAVTLSDYSVPAVPGAFGGSLGYAQKSSPGSDCTTAGGCPGFNGGWVGIALDEWGNYQNESEGRIGGPGFRPQTVGVRGSGQGQAGYRWLQGNDSALSPLVDNRTSFNPAPGHRYQIIVDARNAASATPQTFVAVKRDTTGTGSSYSDVISPFDVFARARTLEFTQAPVPYNWKISFTGSTGDNTNIHEIDGLRVCAQNMAPPSGGTASGFNAIDDSYVITGQNRNQLATQGNIFTKLASTSTTIDTDASFKLKVAALDANGTGVLTTYAASGNKAVTLELIDDTGNTSCNASPSACQNCAKTRIPFRKAAGGAAVTSQTMTFSAGDAGGPKQSPAFFVDNAYTKVLVRMSEDTTVGCSTDWFAIRPTAFTGFATTAGNASATGTPALKAGSDSFTLTANAARWQATATGEFATATASNYTGKPKLTLDVAGLSLAAGTLSPAEFSAFAAGSGSQGFTYGEVGYFYLKGINPGTATAEYDVNTPRGIYDDTWTLVDNSGGKSDCIAGSYSNKLNGEGKYGCNFGLTSPLAETPFSTRYGVGRFIPHHFGITGKLMPRSDLAALSTGTIAAGSSVLTVPGADIGRYIPGNYLRIPGAGGNGNQTLVAKVVSAAGTTVTLDTSAVAPSPSGASVYPVDTFTYMDEPWLMEMTVTAYNAGNAATVNYAGDFAKLNVAGAGGLGNSSPPWKCTAGTQCMGLGAVVLNAAGDRSARLEIDTLSGNGSSPPGNTSWSGGSSVFTANVKFKRETSPDGPYLALQVGAKPLDSDGITLPPLASADTDHCVNLNVVSGAYTAGACNPGAAGTTPEADLRRWIGSTDALYGRLRLANAFGSEFLPLKVPVLAEYWAGNSWAQNRRDSLTALRVPTSDNGGLKFYDPGPRNRLEAAHLCARQGAQSPAGACPDPAPAITVKRLAAGDAWLWLTNPAAAAQGPGTGRFGYADVIHSALNIPPWLSPSNDARVCFGSCGPRSPVIYLRERY